VPRQTRVKIPPPPRRLTLLAYLSLVCAALITTLPYPLMSGDVWLHMTTGRYVLQHHWVPITDHFSFVAADRPHVAHEWLAGVLFHVVYDAMGWLGLTLLRVALVSTIYVLIYRTARVLRARLSVILLAAPLLCTITTFRVFALRPHLFSSLMIASYLYLFFRYRAGGLHPRWLWVLPPLQTLWVNLHGGHVHGLALVACFALGEALHWLRARYFSSGMENALSRVVYLYTADNSCRPKTR
jgi:hypothetical protein